MLTSMVRTFSDPDQYAQSIRGGVADFAVTQRGDFNAKLIRTDLHNIWMQRFSENLGRIFDGSNMVSGRAYIAFRTRPGASLRHDGVEMDGSAILRARLESHGAGSRLRLG
jgi:hypothetical protein